MFLVSVDWIQKEPPIDSMRATMAMRAMNPRAASGPWNLGGMRDFMMFYRPVIGPCAKKITLSHAMQRKR